MHFAQHWILSWFIAEGGRVSLRGRRLITAAGILPDADVLPYAGGALHRWAIARMPFTEAWRSAFDEVHRVVHHHYTHGIGFIALTGTVACLCARPEERGRVGLRAAAACALHALCDVLASGPTWPIYPLWPLSDVVWGVPWSWTLADWPNLLLLGLCLLATRQYAKARGRSPLEAISQGLDARFVHLVRGG